MASFYLLDDNLKIIKTDVVTWTKNRKDASKQIRLTELKKYNARISTVFLGIDHRFIKEKDMPPILFETMIFWNTSYLDEFQLRYTSYDAAVLGHAMIISLIKENIDPSSFLTFGTVEKLLGNEIKYAV